MSLRSEPSDHPSKWSAHDPWSEVKHAPGAFPSSPQPDHDSELSGQHSVAAAVKQRQQEYIRKRHIKVKVGTWNVASISGTEKDLAGWFVSGLGIKGLKQDLSGLSTADDSDSSSGEQIESAVDQESRMRKKSSTLPRGEGPAVPSEDDVGLYVLGLQEVVDISSVTETLRPYYDPNPAKKWKHVLKRSLPRGYVKIAEQQLLGLLILVYAAPDVALSITSVDCSSVGTGALGYVGNKGAVSVRIVLGGTTRMLFVNCHLAAGADQTALTRRIWDTNQILSRTKFAPSVLDGDTNPVDHESIGHEDFAFWFGDLNYRLDDIPGEDVRRLLLLHTRNEYDVMNKSRRKIDSELGYIDADSGEYSLEPSASERSGGIGHAAHASSIEPILNPEDDPASLITTINSLLQHDQLRAQQRLRKAFHDGWREGTIDFLPTYKYDVGSVGMFDSGEKKRSPSWCDRILYRTRKDRLQYEEQIKQEKEARKRDEEMKARGLDTLAEEQEILFNYDPENDGADDDDYNENEDMQDTQSVITQDGHEDIVSLENYVSHQRVLSSDHKPLSAVFDLVYDAVVPELKAKVQQEVARLFDKNENETRPSVTVVVDNPVEGATHADKPADASELNAVDFEDVRYHVPKTRTLTIANTGPIPATIAFIDRASETGGESAPSPSWLKIEVHHDSEVASKENDDLGTSTRFVLSPGDIVTVDLTVHIFGEELVHALNANTKNIDDVLILRILHGRDHFISIKGTWCPTSFCRSLDELVRFPAGVRSRRDPETLKGDSPRGSSQALHSAPKELFDLTEALPKLLERAIADWTMVHQEVTPPWEVELAWPFRGQVWNASPEDRSLQLANIREALDTATTLTEHFDDGISPLARAELLGEICYSFLQTLRDGIISAEIWTVIEANVVANERSKNPLDNSGVQQMVMEALSAKPVHSVAFTFITFMMTRMINELSASAVENEQTPLSPLPRRSRSSTEASEAPSEQSVLSTDSTGTTKSSFLGSFRRHRAGPAATISSPVTQALPERQEKFTAAYSDLLAPVIIRSEQDHSAKSKEKKILDIRRRKILEAFLDSPTM